MRKIIFSFVALLLLINFYPLNKVEGALVSAFTTSVGSFNASYSRFMGPPIVMRTYTAPDGYVITAGVFPISGRDEHRGTYIRIYDEYGNMLSHSNPQDGYFDRELTFTAANARQIIIQVDQSADGGYVNGSGEVNLSVDVADNSAVMDGSGTVLQSARSADINAANAKTSADAAKVAAETAAARANTAATNASNANTNANAAKNMLNGSSNGGKSLAATYDKANASSQDTTYIRNLQLSTLTSHTSLIKPPPN